MVLFRNFNIAFLKRTPCFNHSCHGRLIIYRMPLKLFNYLYCFQRYNFFQKIVKRRYFTASHLSDDGSSKGWYSQAALRQATPRMQAHYPKQRESKISKALIDQSDEDGIMSEERWKMVHARQALQNLNFSFWRCRVVIPNPEVADANGLPVRLKKHHTDLGLDTIVEAAQ